ncbi:LacI family DNA-binding transcriptional regulator [Actinoplanes sp. NPDC051851]|uniref:LacI family DNA-binding transcriptional regulator n=1 Tax=Actinoplanes sp. NPDC051851 TaxID=3154753 RepID=UPI00341EF25D
MEDRRGENRRGENRPGRGRVTLHDVAREAGVSYATASRALNGSDRSVRPENADRVRVAAARLGYLPDLPAQAIARGSTRSAALVVNSVDDPYFTSIAAGASEAAEEAGIILTLAVADQSPGLELQIVRTLRGQRPQVILIAGTRVDGARTQPDLIAELAAYRTAGGRIVLLSQPELPFATIAVDNYGGARRLAIALTGRGYRRFAVVHGDDRLLTSRDRRQGFTDGLREAGLTPAAIATDFSRDGGEAAARQMIESGRIRDVEAIFAVTDVMAIGVQAALRDAGLVPGRDVAVAGFDDIEAASDITPGLTTVRIPLHELGRRALRMALDGDETERVTVPVEVVLRESTPGI